jgi:hypothetical protein
MKQGMLLMLVVNFLYATENDAHPDARVTGNLIYSPKTNSLLLIDGYTKHPADEKNDVYSWDGKKWKRIDASGPVTKSLSTAALNTKTNDIYVFGGVGSKGYDDLRGDIWRFNGKQWSNVITNDIGTRDHCKMVYAANIDAFVMYGGQNQKRNNDSSTWILKNSEWKEMKIEGPGGRFHFGMAYDVVRSKVVLYGGYNSTGLQQDTWEFDGATWKRITNDGPGPRGRFSMVYDDSRKMVILFGGDVWKKKVDTAVSADGQLWDIRNDTWGWDGHNWKKLSESGPSRMLASLGYDPSRKRLVLYGGGDAYETDYADTWEFENNRWIKVTDNGAWKWNGNDYEKVK